MSYAPRILPEGCLALLPLVVGGAAYWMLGFGYLPLPFRIRFIASLLHTLITLLSTIPAIMLCAAWGDRKPWVLMISIPITIVIWVLLFDAIAVPFIEGGGFPEDFGNKAVLEEALSVAGLALASWGVITVLLATYAFRHSNPPRTWAKAATLVACLLFAATVVLLPFP